MDREWNGGMTTGLMLLMLIVMAGVFCVGMKKREQDFSFDVQDSSVLRGLWCLVVILVHTPMDYTNTIQDMIGSFAYIGVTFFFMASAYGLEYGIANKKDYLKKFWRNRLPALLIPAFLANCIFALCAVLFAGQSFQVSMLLNPGSWVKLLLLCYFIFWFVNRALGNWISSDRIRKVIISLLIVAISMICYSKNKGIWRWPTECFGFIYGLFLADLIPRIRGKQNWWGKLAALVLTGGILGLCYLKFKPVPFWGDYCLKVVLGSALTVLQLHFISHVRVGNRAIRFLGSISYEMYLLHDTGYLVIRALLPGIESGLYIWLSMLLTLSFATVVHWGSTKLLELFRTGPKKIGQVHSSPNN